MISNLTESLSKAELELTLQMEDFKKQVENMKEALQTAEEERDRLQALSSKQSKDHKSMMEQSSGRLNDRIKELEDALEDKERQLQDTINEIDTNSQQQLADLKKFYEGEKVRFE